ncbi:hypothetical protein niasHT_029167 [Heterodera trifolii]|uniref:Uncharacterized protein n=1 Tax=Heterodera trifolii TaxID=157864 RepID=A0ABD2JZ48_9BILA
MPNCVNTSNLWSLIGNRPFLGHFGQLLRGGTAAGRAHSSRHLHGRPGRVSSSVPVPRTVTELPRRTRFIWTNVLYGTIQCLHSDGWRLLEIGH